MNACVPGRLRAAFAVSLVAGLCAAATFEVVPLSAAQEVDLPAVPSDAVPSDTIEADSVPAPGSAPVRRVRVGRGGPGVIRGDKNDVVQMGQDIVIDAGEQVLGNVVAVGGDVTVRGAVDEDVISLGGNVHLEAGAQVRGDAVSVGGRVERDPDATVLGSQVSVAHIPGMLFTWQAANFVGHGVKFLARLISLALWAFVAWLVIKLTTTRSARIVGRIESEPLVSLGWGAAGLALLVPATITVAFATLLLVITIIGIPVAVLLVLGYSLGVVLVLLWGAVLGAAAIGGWVMARLAPRLGEPTFTRRTLWGVAAVGAPGLLAELFFGVGLAVLPASLLGGALKAVGTLLTLGAVAVGIGAIARTRAGQPAPIPGDLTSAAPPPTAPIEALPPEPA